MKKAIALIALPVCALGRPAFAQQPPPPPAPPAPAKLQVLIITGQHQHDWKGTTPVLRKILEDTGKFEVRVTEEFRGAGPETGAWYDVVVVNYSDSGRPERRWGPRADAALVDFVKSGKGLVVYHFAMQAFAGWTEYEQMSAANWRPDFGHHSAPHDYTVKIIAHRTSDHEGTEARVRADQRRVVRQPEMAAGRHLRCARHGLRRPCPLRGQPHRCACTATTRGAGCEREHAVDRG